MSIASDAVYPTRTVVKLGRRDLRPAILPLATDYMFLACSEAT